MFRNLKCCFVFGLAILPPICNAYSKGISFPGRESCLSPTKSWKLICREDKKHEGAFSLTLRELNQGNEKRVFNGGRWCEVLWQKEELRLAITDWGGSDFAEILWVDLQRVGPARPLQSVIDMAVIRANVPKEELQGHCYWEALNWQANGLLRFRIFGHTDTKHGREFSHMFVVSLPDGAVTALRSTGPHGGSNGRQPYGSETNRTSAAATSRRSP